MKTKCLFIAFMAMVIAPSVHADTINFTVTLNTSPLIASLAGPFSLAFQLVDGSGGSSGDANNTATLSNFNFWGGAPTGSPIPFGGASGDLTGTVTLTDSDFFNALIQGFTPGSTLSFLVNLTTNVDLGGTPDAFAFSMLDSSGSAIPTLDPSFADTLLTINIDSANPLILTYATDPNRSTVGGSAFITMDAPVVGAPGPTPVPEPSSLMLICTGLFGVTIAAWRKKK
jgi:hypothetical protein